MAVGESTKLLPWIMGGKKYVRAYLKVSQVLRAKRGERTGQISESESKTRK